MASSAWASGSWLARSSVRWWSCMCVWHGSTASRSSGARPRCPWPPWHRCVWGWGHLVPLSTCATKPLRRQRHSGKVLRRNGGHFRRSVIFYIAAAFPSELRKSAKVGQVILRRSETASDAAGTLRWPVVSFGLSVCNPSIRSVADQIQTDCAQPSTEYSGSAGAQG
jgi:hypothetical protein